MSSRAGEHVLPPELVEKYCAAPPTAVAWRELWLQWGAGEPLSPLGPLCCPPEMSV